MHGVKNKLWVILAVVVVAASGWWIGWRGRQASVHYHAGFRIYLDGVLQDYRDYRYMNYTACSEHEEESAEEEQMEKAHLHDQVGDVVHVHRTGGEWGDLLKNAGIALPSDKPLTGYVDGQKVENILDYPIEANRTAILVVGEEGQEHGSEMVPKEHIAEVEAKSELCGS